MTISPEAILSQGYSRSGKMSARGEEDHQAEKKHASHMGYGGGQAQKDRVPGHPREPTR